MFMEYSADHSSDVYRMLNLESKRSINSGDVIWLERKIWSKSKISNEKLSIDDEDHFIAKPTGNTEVNPDMASNQKPALKERTKEKLYCQLKKLESS
jgi:hypothetical protein